MRLCERLQERGLVEIGQADDPRAAALTLTRAGESARQALLAKRSAALATIVDKLDSGQQEALVSLSEALLAKLTTSPMEGGFICRLCDTGVCQPAKCPVHSTVHQLLNAPTGAGATAN